MPANYLTSFGGYQSDPWNASCAILLWLNAAQATRLQLAIAVAGQHLMYFQFLTLPSDIHSIAVSSRFLRVSSVLASVIHST